MSFLQPTLTNGQWNAFFSSIRVKYVRVNFVRAKRCTAQYSCNKVIRPLMYYYNAFQRRIQNSVKHLRWRFFFFFFTIHKKLCLRYLTRLILDWISLKYYQVAAKFFEMIRSFEQSKNIDISSMKKWFKWKRTFFKPFSFVKTKKSFC